VGKSGFIDKDAANGVGLIEGNYGGQKPAWTFFFFLTKSENTTTGAQTWLPKERKES
jgi:hypothetical protein